MKTSFATAISAAIVLMASTVLAAPPSKEDKCEAGKNKLAGAYYACREKAAAAAILKNTAPDYSKCSAKFTEKWDKAETAGETMCPDNIALTGDIDAYIAGQAAAAAGVLAGNAIPKCGDGTVNTAGEHCDGSALDGYTCASFGFHGSLACNAGCDFDMSGCTSCPSPGVAYGNACWVLGAVAGTCDAACATLGMVYDPMSSTIAGSDGSNANCVAVLDLTGAPGDVLDNPGVDPCTLGLGCAVVPQYSFRARCPSPATDGSSSGPGIRRACACK